MRNIALITLKELAMKELQSKHPSIPVHAIPQPKYSDKTSNDLTRCIIDYINLSGYQAERINSMGKQLDKRKTSIDVLGRKRTVGSVIWIKGSTQNGTADISATILGKSVKIEVKCEATGDKYQSKAQMEYQKKIEKAGGIYIIVRNFEGFFSWYQNFNN